MKIFKLLIIGDEILSGKRKDCHLDNLISALSDYGFKLNQSIIIGDEPELIVATLRSICDENSVVFCCGGIGATPDDYTRQCAAEAFNQEFLKHAEATALIEKQFGEAAYPKRILMAYLPKQARVIPNPINQVPGFSVGDCHFMPGFPQMAEPMMKWVLAHYYAQHKEENADVERSVWIYNTPESELIDLMNLILEEYEGVKVASLPKVDERHSKVDLAIKGKQENVDAGFEFLLTYLSQHNIAFEI